MGRIVGIDLGTTYSAVAIPEERSGEGFMTIRECPGYSVILDDNKRRIVPSVVAEDSQGNIVVGHAAKGRAGLSPEPIMFAKRYMGEDKTFQLARQGVLRPEQVSAHILRHLKQMAEKRLGETVDEAVITVPAYFSGVAKQMTEKAGELAGLRVAQIAQEPVAAALMYCAGDPRDPLRVMTYDLGGGTFDIAILEKRDGTISTDSIRAFDGDRFLGGYDFDKLLAEWLVKQLDASGYDLRLEDTVAFAKLMVYAERAKIDLSKIESYEFNEVATGITDHAGKTVTIENLSLTRQQFEVMIWDKVERTIALCRQAMTEKANPPIRTDQIDEILMVGGSSRIPLIGRRLEEEFGRKPKLVEPDLCVALGAAIIAGTKPKQFGCLKLDPIRAETDLPTLTVTGRVIPGDNLKNVEGCEVALRALDRSFEKKRKVGAEGAFVFDGVKLAPNAQTEFTLVATSPAGQEVARHRFAVKQTDKPKGGLVEAVTNVLAKPIGVVFEDGFLVVAPERTPLPYEAAVVQAETRDTSGKIRVPIQEENTPLGELVMEGITDLPVGSAVEITLTFQADYQIQARAWVPSLKREEKIEVIIPVRPQKSLDELKKAFNVLSARAEDAIKTAGRAAKFGNARVKRLNDRLWDVEAMLKSQRPEPAAIQDGLDEIESLIRDLSAGWRPDPPRAVFEQKVREAERLLAQATKQEAKVTNEGYDKRLEAIQSEASKAYAAQNTTLWGEAYDRVTKLCAELEQLNEQAGPPTPPPDPPALKNGLAYELRQLVEEAKRLGRYPELESDFKEAAAALERIDAKAPDAMFKIRDWYFTRFEELRKRLGAPEVTDDPKINLLRKSKGGSGNV